MKNAFDGFRWLHEPARYSLDDGILQIVPEGKTDFFRSPDGSSVRDNACLFYTEVSGDFTASVHVSTELDDFGDAGALTIRQSENLWAKVCLERSPAGELSVVTVVTDGESDDCNGELLNRGECRLRITRRGKVFAMHHSLDGKIWRFARTFRGSYGERIMVGVHAQAPFGSGCRAAFRDFTLTGHAVSDFRSGE